MAVREGRKRNPKVTRASILEAAERLFVRKGFAATSMSRIAREAEVTKSLIHHHFGGKEDLWREVKRQRISRYVAEQNRLIAEESREGDASVLERSIKTYFRFLEGNPEWVRLSAWMMLEDPRLSEVAYPELLRGGVARIRAEQEAGRLRADVEPEHILIQFVSLCLYWFMARETTLNPLVTSGDSERDEAYLEDLLKVFMEGVLRR